MGRGSFRFKLICSVLTLLFAGQIVFAELFISTCMAQTLPEKGLQAEQAYNDGEYAKAIPLLNAALSDNALNEASKIKLLEMLAYACYYENQKDKALNAYGQLKLLKPGHQHDDIFVSQDMQDFLKVTPARLTVTSVPGNLTMMINGVEQSEKTGSALSLLAGDYTLEVISPDASKWIGQTVSLTLTDGEQKALNVVLQEKKGSFLKNKWTWIGAGALAVGLYFILKKEDPKTSNLPEPPDHPTL